MHGQSLPKRDQRGGPDPDFSTWENAFPDFFGTFGGEKFHEDATKSKGGNSFSKPSVWMIILVYFTGEKFTGATESGLEAVWQTKMRPEFWRHE